MIAIRKYRKQMKWTQSFLAKQLGTSTSTIGMWESGERRPSINMLKKIAKILQCTTDDLLETIDIDNEKR